MAPDCSVRVDARDEHQAMVTAGLPFRLIQLSRFWALDQEGHRLGQPSPGFHDPSSIPTQTTTPVDREAFAETEERRRTFWLAYLFDWSFYIRDKSLLTFHQDMVSPTRLLYCFAVSND